MDRVIKLMCTVAVQEFFKGEGANLEKKETKHLFGFKSVSQPHAQIPPPKNPKKSSPKKSPLKGGGVIAQIVLRILKWGLSLNYPNSKYATGCVLS